MCDRLEEVKGNHEHLDAGKMNPYAGEVILLSPEDYEYLIAEVERLQCELDVKTMDYNVTRLLIEQLPEKHEGRNSWLDLHPMKKYSL